MKKLKEIAKAEMTQTFSLEVSTCGKIVEVFTNVNTLIVRTVIHGPICIDLKVPEMNLDLVIILF